MCTSLSGFAAHESGAGVGAWCSVSFPAIKVMLVSFPVSSFALIKGIFSDQSIAKWGGTFLLAFGKLSQSWKSKNGFGFISSSKGNISECCTPLPAVIHCTSPLPKRPAAPRESA